MSFTRQLLCQIADEMGRNRKDMQNFINVLQKNWYDSKQSLQTLTVNDYDRFEIPRRVSAAMIQKLGKGNKNQQKQAEFSSGMDEQFSIDLCAQRMKKKLSPEQFNFCIETLNKIFRNIRDNLTQQKYRTLKKSNKKIGDLVSVPECADILVYGGFQNKFDVLIMKQVNLDKIDYCLDGLIKHDESKKFNPYQAQFISMTGDKQPQGESSVIFNDKLQQLEREREVIMSKKIKDRKIRMYKQQPRGQSRPDSNWNDERQLNPDERMYMESMKEKLKHFGEDPKFMNRRKQQYIQLAKKPCFDQTLIRVKLPDKYIWEGIFSPLETMGDLVEVFEEYVENKKIDYYLYMTPPVVHLRGMILRQTFYQNNCVPSGLFYLGSNDNLPSADKFMRMKKTSKFGMFG